MSTDTQKTTDLLVAVLADLAPVVGGISAGQLQDPTPCTELDVSQLRTHVLGWLTTFAGGFADPGGQAPLDRLDGYAVPADAAAEVRSASATLAAALRDGAATRPLRLGGSAMPGDMALSMILWEYQVHGWDLARATGQAFDPAESAVRGSYEMLAASTEPAQREPIFGPVVPVPDEAPLLDRAIGLSGRDPVWPNNNDHDSGSATSSTGQSG